MTTKKTVDAAEARLLALSDVVHGFRQALTALSVTTEQVRQGARETEQRLRRTVEHPVVGAGDDFLAACAKGDSLAERYYDAQRYLANITASLTEARAHAAVLAEMLKEKDR